MSRREKTNSSNLTLSDRRSEMFTISFPVEETIVRFHDFNDQPRWVLYTNQVFTHNGVCKYIDDLSIAHCARICVCVCVSGKEKDR